MTAAPPSGLPEIGAVLAGKYRVERVLGQGGMGIVYAAQHELLAQRVAVKLLLAEGPQRADASVRFLAEARAAARIQHENIARVSDVGTLENGTPYMVMEFLEGSDLSALVQAHGPMPVVTAVDYLLQALEAVAQAHALGIVHRDLKPANLFLARKQDGSQVVKVLDFGISKTTDPLQTGAQTSTQSMLGSPYYMSPEQLRSSKNVDARADIWSMGVILYELVTATLPFQSDTLGGLFAAILEQEPAPMSSIRRDVPPAIDGVVRKCLARRPDDRFANAAELAWGLTPFASPAGRASAERVQARGLGTTGNSGPAFGTTGNSGPHAVGGMTAPGHVTGGRTAESWQTSGAQAPMKKTPWAAIVAAGVVVAAAGAFGVWRVTASSSSPAAASSGEAATAAVTAAASAAPSPAASSAAPAATPPPTAASSEASAAPSSAPEAPSAASEAPTAGAKAPARPGAAPARTRPGAPTASPRAPAPTYDPTKDSRF